MKEKNEKPSSCARKTKEKGCVLYTRKQERDPESGNEKAGNMAEQFDGVAYRKGTSNGSGAWLKILRIA
jgi:hypothetical protein